MQQCDKNVFESLILMGEDIINSLWNLLFVVVTYAASKFRFVPLRRLGLFLKKSQELFLTYNYIRYWTPMLV